MISNKDTTTSEIKPIETVYKGYRFRSRLEARWAVFFDTLKIEYKYEIEGFQNQFGYKYLPDFYFPESKTWVEVKGDPLALYNNYEKWAELLDWGSVLPDFDGSRGTTRGLLLLGDIPNASVDSGCCFHPIIQHYKGLERGWVMFSAGTFPIHYINANIFTRLFDLEVTNGMESERNDGWKVRTLNVPSPYFYPDVNNAYIAARQARFEHGENH
jgi:hypothetical protein